MSAPELGTVPCITASYNNAPPGRWGLRKDTSQFASEKLIIAKYGCFVNALASLCVWIADFSISPSHCNFKAFSAPITCLCRGPLNPKLAAIRSVWSSRTPSNISMTSWRQSKGNEKGKDDKWVIGKRMKRKLKCWTTTWQKLMIICIKLISRDKLSNTKDEMLGLE